MEAGTGGTHPLITQLRPLFAELHNNSSGTTITAVVRRLEYIIDEEKDGLFHRNAMKSTADARLLPQWLNRQLELLFEKPDTHLAGVRVLRALQTVEYVDLTEMTSLFSRLLVRCVISTVDFPTSTEAAAGWGLLLNVGGNAMEGIVNECIRFSIALLRCPGHDAAFLTHSSDMGASPSVPPSMHSPTYSPPTSSSNPDLLGSGSGGDHRAPNGSTQARLDRAQPSPSPEGVTRDSPQFSSAPQLAQATSGESRNPLPEASERPTAPSMIELAKVGSLALGNGDGEPLDLSHTTKLAGCLLLQQVARKAPTAVVGHIHDALEGLQMAIIDASLQVRLCAADVLLSIMRLCYRTLEERHFREWQDRWMHSVLRGLNFASSAVLHGSLLTFNALLSSIITHRDEAGGGSSVVEVTSLTSRGIHEVWNCAIQQLSSSSSSEVAPIREEILNVLTLMAQYDGPQFLETTAEQLKALHARVFTATTGYDERTLLFTSLSRLIRVLPEVVPLFLESTIAHIYTSLTPRPNRDRCPAAATCLATLTEVKPYAVRPYLQYLLKPLFSGTITEDFTQNVAKLCAVFPELRSTCLSRTLEATKDQLRIAHQRHQSSAYSASECRTFILANLNALGSLDFAGYSTLSFLSEVVVKYISDPHEDIRRSSINLCFKLVLSGCSSSFCVQSESGRVQHRGHEHIRLVSTIMKKLANAAVADPESDIRLHTLEHFTTRHDQLLAMQNIASILFPALHDKFQNQLAAVRLLGRISPLNPSCICPMLRCVMVQCAADLRLFPQAKKQEQATAVLSAVIECAPAMARPYISSLLHDCAGRLKEVGSQPTPVITALLSCIGKLTCYAEGDDVAVVASLRPFVVAHILDASSTAKKQEAIRTLGEIIRTTKEVNVYEEHPRLLPVLLSALHGGFKETWPLRQDILKLMGIIGAVDPVRLSQIVSAQQHPSAVGAETDNSVLPAGSLRTEDSIAVHVVRNVLNVLQLPSLSDDQCISAAGVLAEILSLTKTDEVFLTAFYPEIFAAILQRISLQPKIREELIHCLTRMVPLCDVYVHQHMSDIMGTVSVFINTAKLNVLVEILALFAEIRRTLGERFRPYLAHILPPIISVVHAAPRMSEVAFSFLVRMGKMLDGYLTNVVPCVCDVAVNPLLQPNCRVAALQALRQFARRLPRLFFYSSQCMHTLCYVLREHTSTHASVVSAALAACVDVARNLGGTFDNYTMILHPILDAMGPEGQQTKAALVNVISMGGRVVTSDYVDGEDDLVPLTTSNLPQALPKRQGAAGSSEDKYALLRNTLLIQDRVTEEDWNSWLKQLSVELLRASPSLSHGYAYYLAQNHEPFARHMLHSAFAVCYAEMDTATRKTVTRRLEAVLGDKQVPSEVLQELLNLSEYMERLESRFTRRDASQKSSYSNLLFDVNILMESTERCNLFAKALHYVEQQFNETIRDYELGRLRGTATPLHKDQWKRVLQLSEKAIYLFNVLGQRESAEGVLEYVQGNFISLTGKLPDELPSMMDAQLFEKLQWWSQSLRAYQQRLQVEPNKFIHIDGLMRSLDNLGDYSRLLDSWKLFAPRVSRKEASDLAFWGSHAAWLLRRWDEMETITALIPEDGYVGTTATFYRAVLCVRKQQFHEAERFVRLCRKRLDHTLSTLVAESYNRAYPIFVGLQQLSELEEFIFVQRNNQPLEPWRRLWEKRLSVMAYSGWGGTLANHTLMTDAMDELDMWLRFVSLSRANGRERTSSEVLYELLGSQSLSHALKQPVLPTPAIALAAFQHMHDLKERDHAIELLEQYVSTMDPNSNDIMEVSSRPSLAMCHAKLANWLFDQANANGTQLDAAPAVVRRVLAHLSRATSLDGENGAIWHSWARFNHALVHQTPPSHTLEHHLICALDGYMRSVRLSQELEDILGFLSLWFHHGSRTEVLHNLELQTNILMVSSSVWLKVIPQIIARMDSEDSVISESVCKLLSLVAKAHPQALLYSLNVTTSSLQGGARSSEPNERRKASQRILARIAELHRHGQVLVNEAALVCQELVRCAVLWTELWFDELERAWCQWGRDQNVRTVRGMLQPLLDLMERPETMAESHFVTEFGELIGHACECLDQAMLSSGAEAEAFMDDAWNRFKSAVRRMEEQISSMSSLALQLVSPKLLQHGKDLSLVVPGQYHESGNYPHILSFQPTLKVMNSKQHPRRLYIQGSDGEVYKFLLKGHEDLRLDERVMQLLAFVNTLLDKHTTIQRRDGTIQVFSVTPLSDNAGLVGWVDHCETLHQLIREYRVHSKHLSIEVNIMQSFGVNLERLMPIQHVEPFELALEQTDGTDLAQSLWTRAPSTESWVDRRSTYISSLATMSMVGHILGLGDRHPSNLMIDAFSGRVVHIDFGDCFEVAQHRTAFPEKVPFRLTRMLIKAMDMGTIEGIFPHACTGVMRVLREEGSSILALLEAFVHDPLVSWWRGEEETEECTEVPDTITTEADCITEVTSSHTTAPRAPTHLFSSPGSARPTSFAMSSSYIAMGESFKRIPSAVGSLPMKRAKELASRRTTPTASLPKSSTPQSPTTGGSTQLSKAQKVVNRIKEKLEGREFVTTTTALYGVGTRGSGGMAMHEELTVEAQVSRLLQVASSHENLCVHYQGWCPFW